MGKVYITGAGPGDIELLTLKAYNIIQKADVILYDRLINEEILNLAPKNAILVYVGKEDGKHTIPQDDINRLLYNYAIQYQNVVRLKGGDPFVFGRGGEEALFLALNGIEFEIIPGITSAIAVPAYSGIPLTFRGMSSSFAVLTGHEDPNKGELSVHWESLKEIETLVFLMGVKNRQYIAQKLIEYGRDRNQPVALIHAGTTEKQYTIVCTLGELAENPPEINPPAVIVIGNVVYLREKLHYFK